MAIISEDKGDARADADTQYTISPGDVFKGSLEPGNDRDYVRVELTGGKYYEVKILSIESPDIDIIGTGDMHTAGISDNGFYLPTNSRFIFGRYEVSTTYYIIVKSDNTDFSGNYELSITEYTPSVATYDEIADALYAGRAQPPRAYDVSPGGVLTADITGLSEDWQKLAGLGLEAWTNVTGIKFELVDDQNANIIFDDEQSSTYTIPTRTDGATLFASRINLSNSGPGNTDIAQNPRALYVLIHEIGHALGFDHPGPDYGRFNPIFLNDSWQATVMSYYPQREDSHNNASYAVPITPMIADIIAIHKLYGAPAEIRTGDTVYGYDSNVGGYLGEVFALWTGERDAPFDREIALTLYDNGGNDTLDLRTDTMAQRIDLSPEGISDVYGLIGNLVIARNTLIENVIAGTGDDWISGNSAPNRLDGGAGSDYLDGAAGADWVTYQRSDTGVTVNLEDNTISGGHAEGDVLVNIENLSGSSYDDVLTGDDGANSLEGGAGADTLIGGDGTDTASYERSSAGVVVRLHSNEIRGGDADGDTYAGMVTVEYTDSNGATQQETVPDIENLLGSVHADTLAGDSRDNRLAGGPGDDRLYGGPGGGDDVLSGGTGADALYGGIGDDVLDGGPDADILRGGPGADTASYIQSAVGVEISLFDGTVLGGDAEGDVLDGIENLTGSAYADTLEGDAGPNRLDGADGADELRGNDGNDILMGRAGTDLLEGGAGEDRLDGAGGPDTLRGNDGDDMLDGGDGDDVLEGGAGADHLYGGDGVDLLSYAGSDAGVEVRLSSGNSAGGHAEGDVFAGFENIEGSDYNDILGGDGNNNYLSGGAGNDGLWGSGGDDVLEGGAGADRLFGGAGEDWVTYRDSDEAVTINLGEGAGTGGHAEGDTISEVENVEGSDHDDVLEGDGGINRLNGGAGADDLRGAGGDDVLEGGAGADRLDGGTGIDTAFYPGSNEAISVNLSEGTATGGHAEGDTLIGIEKIIGSIYGDTLVGGGGNDRLDGARGDDILEGGAGADRLDGGFGSDTVTYRNSNAAVSVNLAEGALTGGHAEGDEIINVEVIEGSIYDDTLTGDSGSNRLYGGEGNDVLDGGEGLDLLDGGPGTDTVSYSTSKEAMGISLESGAWRFSNDHERETIIGIENVIGSDYGDYIQGDSGTNELYGGDGNDEIVGWAGDDKLFGEAGDDGLLGTTGANRLDGGTGMDMVLYFLSDEAVTVNLEDGTALGGHAEGDVLVAIENIWGSDHDDTLSGDSGVNLLFGGPGDDVLQGNGGNDVLEGEAGADRLDGGPGLDTASYSLSNSGVTVNMREGIMEGDAAEGDVLVSIEGIEGSVYDDVLEGDNGDNRLSGSFGDDTLKGNEGADIFDFSLDFPYDFFFDLFPDLSGGNDIVSDFTDNEDLLDLTFYELSGFDDLTISSDANGVAIDLTNHGGGIILLEGFDIANLDASDFIF